MAKYVRVVKYDEYYTGGHFEDIVKRAVGKIYKCLNKEYFDGFGLCYLIDIPGLTAEIWIRADHCEDVNEKYIDAIIEETEF